MAKTKTVEPPSPQLLQSVLTVIQATVEPLTASQLSKLLAPIHKLSEARLTPILDDFIAAGKLQPFPPKTAKGKSRYWDRDLDELSRLLMVGVLEKKGALSKVDLRKATKSLTEVQFQTAFQRLIEARTLFEHPPLPRKKSSTFGVHPPSPDPYLKELGLQLTKVVAQLLEASVPRHELRRSLVQLVEATGIPFGSIATPPVVAPSPSDTPVDLVSLMKRVEPAADNGALVAARELRSSANLEKSQFDRAVLELARQGRLMLHRHDFAGGLSPAERDELVTDGAGTYYVGMALRRDV